jgi:hypothetical protein
MSALLPEDALGDHLATVAELGDDDLHLVASFIDALVIKPAPPSPAASIDQREFAPSALGRGR